MSGPFEREELLKLPMWAREKIEMLQRQVAEQKKDVADLCTALDLGSVVIPGCVEIDAYGRASGLTHRGPRCLPAGTAVDFHLARVKAAAFRCHMADDVLKVMSIYGMGLTVVPEAANVVRIKVVE